MDTILDAMEGYMTALDWSYILTLLVMAYFISKDSIVDMIKSKKFAKTKLAMKKVPKAWRVFGFGVVYGLLTYWMRDYHGKEKIEGLVQSLTFTIVFHKLLLQKFEKFIDAKLKL